MTGLGRILIADDEDIFLRSTADLLRMEGYEVDTASDGINGAKLLEAHRYDLLISDIRMPGNQDLDLARRSPAHNFGLPIILVTGYPSMPTALQAMKLPVIAYLVKPIDFDELLVHVQRGVGLRQIGQTLNQSTARLEHWVHDMRKLQENFITSPQSFAQGSLQGALALSLGNIAQALLDFKTLFEAGSGILPQSTSYCPISNCPKLEAYERAIRDGVETLERTKNAFKSKDLGQLRQRFESVLETGLSLEETES